MAQLYHSLYKLKLTCYRCDMHSHSVLNFLESHLSRCWSHLFRRPLHLKCRRVKHSCSCGIAVVQGFLVSSYISYICNISNIICLYYIILYYIYTILRLATGALLHERATSLYRNRLQSAITCGPSVALTLHGQPKSCQLTLVATCLKRKGTKSHG